MKDEIENNSSEGFISRWSKRKSTEKSNEINKENVEDENLFKEGNNKEKKIDVIEEIDESQYDELDDQELLNKFKLPDPETIKKEKGLDLFFKDGIPDRLRQIALRRVWKLNPIIRFADAEINDYHEDFTDAATVIEGMQTAYQVGKGYLSDILKEQDEDIDEFIEEDKKELKKKNVKNKKNIKKAKASKSKQNTPVKDNIKKETELKDIKNQEIQVKEENITQSQDTDNHLEEKKLVPKAMVFRPRQI